MGESDQGRQDDRRPTTATGPVIFPNNAHAAVVMYPSNGNPLIYAAPIGTWGSHHIASDRCVRRRAGPRQTEGEAPLSHAGRPQRHVAAVDRSVRGQRQGCVLEMLQSKGGVGDRGYRHRRPAISSTSTRTTRCTCRPRQTRSHVIPNEDGYNLVTNHIVLDEMRSHFVARKPRAVGSGFVDPEAGSVNRRQSEKFLIEQNYGKLDVRAVINIMSSHYDYSSGRENIFAATPCQHGEFKGRMSGTNLSTVVKLAEDTVWIALGNPCISQYTKITIGTREEVVAATKEAMKRAAPATTQQD